MANYNNGKTIFQDAIKKKMEKPKLNWGQLTQDVGNSVAAVAPMQPMSTNSMAGNKKIRESLIAGGKDMGKAFVAVGNMGAKGIKGGIGALNKVVGAALDGNSAAEKKFKDGVGKRWLNK